MSELLPFKESSTPRLISLTSYFGVQSLYYHTQAIKLIKNFRRRVLGGFGDGGMIITNNEELAEKIRVLRVHGAKPKYHHSLIGCNSRLDAIQAAILCVKLRYLDQWHEGRRVNAANYDRLFEDFNMITPYVERYNDHIYNQYVIRVNQRDELTLQRDFLK